MWVKVFLASIIFEIKWLVNTILSWNGKLRNPRMVKWHHLVVWKRISVQKLSKKNKNKRHFNHKYNSTAKFTWLTCHGLSSAIHCGAMHCERSQESRDPWIQQSNIFMMTTTNTSTTSSNCCLGMSECLYLVGIGTLCIVYWNLWNPNITRWVGVGVRLQRRGKRRREKLTH